MKERGRRRGRRVFSVNVLPFVQSHLGTLELWTGTFILNNSACIGIFFCLYLRFYHVLPACFFFYHLLSCLDGTLPFCGFWILLYLFCLCTLQHVSHACLPTVGPAVAFYTLHMPACTFSATTCTFCLPPYRISGSPYCTHTVDYPFLPGTAYGFGSEKTRKAYTHFILHTHCLSLLFPAHTHIPYFPGSHLYTTWFRHFACLLLVLILLNLLVTTTTTCMPLPPTHITQFTR